MSGKTIVVLQSNYIPWKGYFDLLAIADEFLLFDEVQYTKNDWRNRNRIVLGGKLRWLTIPVRTAGLFGAPIEQIEVAGSEWAQAHWETMKQAYRHAPHFKAMAPALEQAYRSGATFTHLSEVNEHFLRSIATLLELGTPIVRSKIVPRTTPDATDRLLEICKARAATDYVSGPAARNYLRPAAFKDAGIALHFANYSGYPTYQQNRQPFEHGVSIVDTLMQCGANARKFLKTFADRRAFLVPA